MGGLRGGLDQIVPGSLTVRRTSERGRRQTAAVGNIEPPVFDEGTVPKDALRATLEWLEAVVPDCRAVRSAGIVKRVRGPLWIQVRLQSSSWSRRGAGTWVDPSLTVWDKGFGRWRADHADLTWQKGDYVYSDHALVRPGVQLFGPLPDYASLADLKEGIERKWLPLVDLFGSTSRLAEELPAVHTRFSTIQWLVYREDVPAARRLLERYLDHSPSLRQAIDEGRAAAVPPPGTPIRNEIRELWGPYLERLGVLAPGEPLPGVPPEVIPEPVDSRAEILGILGQLGRVSEL